MVSHPSHRLTPLGYLVVGLLWVKDPAGVPFSFDPYAAHAAHPPYNWGTPVRIPAVPYPCLSSSCAGATKDLQSVVLVLWS